VIDLRAEFQEHFEEVEAYMGLVTAVEHAAQSGTPILQTRSGTASTVKPLQQKVLCGGVYLHLYNLVEATISRCVAAVETAASSAKRWRADDLSVKLRREWVRSIARTHEELSTDHRLRAAIDLCNHLVAMLPAIVKIEKGRGGNWDDIAIFRFADRIGIPLQLGEAIEARVKQPYRDNKGALTLIKCLRNKLAHGEMSFAECGDGRSSTELDELVHLTRDYLEKVISAFEGFVSRYEFLEPEKRPLAGGG
jgi:hypothetical protein